MKIIKKCNKSSFSYYLLNDIFNYNTWNKRHMTNITFDNQTHDKYDMKWNQWHTKCIHMSVSEFVSDTIIFKFIN